VGGGEMATAYLNIVYQPLKEPDGTVDRIMIMITDVTEQVVAANKKKKKVRCCKKRRPSFRWPSVPATSASGVGM
jgi:hypothetical protein